MVETGCFNRRIQFRDGLDVGLWILRVHIKPIIRGRELGYGIIDTVFGSLLWPGRFWWGAWLDMLPTREANQGLFLNTGDSRPP